MTLKTMLAAALAASSALAQGLNHPAGLQPGDEYRVLFVTDGTRDATATDIADYDAFVTAEANAVPFLAARNTNWRVVGSSAAVSAMDHTGTVGGGVPIYRPDGVRLADDYDRLWDAANTPLLAAPEVTASGALMVGFVWTGTADDGSAHSWPLGGVASQVIVGRPDLTNVGWVSANTRLMNESHHLYGISDVLKVPYPDYPHDLKPGDQFRIAFVTDATSDASSSDIADYDAFVTADAQAVPALQLYGTNWRAIASTPSVGARTHTATSGAGVPIYRPDGTRLANGNGNLWGGSGHVLLAPINVTPSGATKTGQVWTGTGPSGSSGNNCLGDAGGTSISGRATDTIYSWVFYGISAQSNSRPLYGISDVITVPEPRHPADLQPGDRYRVLMVTDGARDASSSDIADYDAFVTADADAAPAMRLLATNWRAVASTPSITAKEHTDSDPSVGGVPVYRPDGTRIADDYARLWGTMAGPLLDLPTVTGSGATTTALHVWSGTSTDGGAAFAPLGGSASSAYGGNPMAVGIYWIWGSVRLKTVEAPLYGISDILTVPLPAVETSRVGTPPNTEALLPGQTSAPVIGRTWDPRVDHTTFVTDAAIDVLLFGAAQVNVPMPGFGTVLCDQLLSSSLTALPGQTFSLEIADNTALLGVSLSAQALSIDWSWGMHLSNALDITIGSR